MSNPIDTKVISKLAEILDKNNLTELEYKDEECKITLTRQYNMPSSGAYVPAPQPVVSQINIPQSSATQAQATEDCASNNDYSDSPNAVKSPMVGVVYLSSDPNSSNYVNVGDSVSVGDTVCLIEAMKTFNPVKAHKSGRVSKILVESGDPVEYGAPLVVIE